MHWVVVFAHALSARVFIPLSKEAVKKKNKTTLF